MERLLGKRFSSPAPYPLSLKRIKKAHREERDNEKEGIAAELFKQLEPDSDWNSSKEDTEKYTAKRESGQKVPQNIPQSWKRHEKKEKIGYLCDKEG
jgi:hypothetical protein